MDDSLSTLHLAEHSNLKLGDNGNKFLSSAAGVFPLWLSHLHRCPGITGMRLCKWNWTIMRMLGHLSWRCCWACYPTPCVKLLLLSTNESRLLSGRGQSLLSSNKWQDERKWPQLALGMFGLDIRKIFFTKRVDKHWYRCPMKCVSAHLWRYLKDM